MRIIPVALRRELSKDPEYKICQRSKVFKDHECWSNPITKKRIEWEHAFIYAGKQINERWAIVSLCWWAHEGPGKNKRLNQFLALSQAEVEDLRLYPRLDWRSIGKDLSTEFLSLIRIPIYQLKTINQRNNMQSKAESLLLSEARQFRSKAVIKRREADRLDQQAEEMEKAAVKLKK